MKKLLFTFLLTLPLASAKAGFFQYDNFNFSGLTASWTRTEILSGSFRLNQTAQFSRTPFLLGGHVFYPANPAPDIAMFVTAFSGTISGCDGYNGTLLLSDLNAFYATGPSLSAN